jgi:soluble lytic murein transglycosylase
MNTGTWLMQMRNWAIAAISVAAISQPAAAQTRIVALSESDERAYAAAFSAIERHDWRNVTAALHDVEDDTLVGIVRGRMLLSRSYSSSWSEMTQWLDHYGDYGMADDIYERAMDGRSRTARRRGTQAPSPERARGRVLPGTPASPPGDSASARVGITRIAELVGANDFSGARDLALQHADGPRSGPANWYLGLIAYRQRDYAEAVRRFELSTAWGYNGGWASAASHYWAARARLAAGETEGVTQHLEAAAQRPWTFYGQLAETQLGRDSALQFAPQPLEQDSLVRFMERHPGARRAAALAQLGRLSEVESELRRLHGDLDRSEDQTFLALAVALNAPAAQLRAAEYGGPETASGFCPVTDFRPDNGFELDRALIYAIVRQESYFNPKAVSTSNARGLMQMLASTAHDMDRSTNYRRNPTALYEPGLNMRLGQSYIQWLMQEFHSDGDLGRVFAAYNGGPGWLSRYLATQPSDIDPLLLLEMLPRQESRDYAERALSHMALCRKIYGQPTPELDSLASGGAAQYRPLDRNSSFAGS